MKLDINNHPRPLKGLKKGCGFLGFSKNKPKMRVLIFSTVGSPQNRDPPKPGSPKPGIPQNPGSPNPGPLSRRYTPLYCTPGAEPSVKNGRKENSGHLDLYVCVKEHCSEHLKYFRDSPFSLNSTVSRCMYVCRYCTYRTVIPEFRIQVLYSYSAAVSSR